MSYIKFFKNQGGRKFIVHDFLLKEMSERTKIYVLYFHQNKNTNKKTIKLI